MKPASALQLLHWAVLAFVFLALGQAWAQDAHPLDLDQTRAALTSTEAALRDRNLTDPDLQACAPRTTRSRSRSRARSPI